MKKKTKWGKKQSIAIALKYYYKKNYKIFAMEKNLILNLKLLHILFMKITRIQVLKSHQFY
jgi:hypothetical protein